MQQPPLVHRIISFVWFGVRRLPHVCVECEALACSCSMCTVRTRLFAATCHSVSLLHAVTESLSLSTAHGAQCDLQLHLSTNRGGRASDTVHTHAPHPGSLAPSWSACTARIKHTNPVYIRVMARSQACWHSLGLGESTHHSYTI